VHEVVAALACSYTAPWPWQIYEKSPTKVKNFGFWFRYDSRTGTHNAYKEYRAMALTDAVNALCALAIAENRSASFFCDLPCACGALQTKTWLAEAVRRLLPFRFLNRPNSRPQNASVLLSSNSMCAPNRSPPLDASPLETLSAFARIVF